MASIFDSLLISFEASIILWGNVKKLLKSEIKLPSFVSDYFVTVFFNKSGQKHHSERILNKNVLYFWCVTGLKIVVEQFIVTSLAALYVYFSYLL
jgi:hypothetical protein